MNKALQIWWVFLPSLAKCPGVIIPQEYAQILRQVCHTFDRLRVSVPYGTCKEHLYCPYECPHISGYHALPSLSGMAMYLTIGKNTPLVYQTDTGKVVFTPLYFTNGELLEIATKLLSNTEELHIVTFG